VITYKVFTCGHAERGHEAMRDRVPPDERRISTWLFSDARSARAKARALGVAFFVRVSARGMTRVAVP